MTQHVRDIIDPGVRSYRLETRLAEDKPDARTVGGSANGVGVWDSHGTRFMPGAFEESIAERQSVPVLWAHDRKQPIGKTTRLAEVDGRLEFDARLTPGVQRADEALALVADEAIGEVSIGFEPLEWREIEGETADEVRADKGLPDWWPVVEFTRARVREVSPVTFGSNPSTDIAMRAAREVASSLDEYRRLLSGPIGAETPEDSMSEKNQTPAPALEADNDNLEQIRAELAAVRAELAEAKLAREEAQAERDFVKFCAECSIGSTFEVKTEAAQRALFNLRSADVEGYNALADTVVKPEDKREEPAKPEPKPWGVRHGSGETPQPAGQPTNAIELKRACLDECGGDETKARDLYLERAPKLGIL